MKYIVYQTVNKINNKIYIGVHGTETDDFDGYIGCGVSIYRPSTYEHPNTPFKHAVRKYGTGAFIRTTLKEFDNEEDAYKLEAELVNEEFLKREDVYNLVPGGCSGKYAVPKTEVHMYDLDGNYIRSFSGINIAARTVNPNAANGSHISRAIKQGYVYQGYQWSYEKVPFMKKITKHREVKVEELKAYQGPKVGRFDDNDNLLEVFDNLTLCKKAGYKNANEVIRGNRIHCKGFRFKYLD